MTDNQISFSTNVDLELETSALLAHYSDFISAGRQVLPRLSFYHEGELYLSINSRSYEMPEDGNDEDRNKAIKTMMYMLPALKPDLAILSFWDPVKIVGGIASSIIIIAVNPTGALAKVYPWEMNGEEVVFDMDAKLDPTSPAVYSPLISRMLPVFVRTRRFGYKPTEMMDFLSARGFEVSLFGDWERGNLNARTEG